MNQPSFCTERLDRITGLLQGEVDAGIVAGCSLLVGGPDDVAYEQYVGQQDMEQGIALGEDSILRIASMTKGITSLAVMMLLEEGELLLTDPLADYIPEFADPTVLLLKDDQKEGLSTRPARGQITIRQLLTHTSGIAYSFTYPRMNRIYRDAGVFDWGHIDAIAIGEKMRLLASLPLAFDPGKHFLYGLNTDVLGYLVEVVSGMTLEEFFEQRILHPLGMQDTHFYPPQEKAGSLCPVYMPAVDISYYDSIDLLHARDTYRPDPSLGLRLLDQATTDRLLHIDFEMIERPHESAGTYFSGGAGLHSTLRDYSRFCQFLIREGELDGVRLVSPTTVRSMRSNQIGKLYMDIDGSQVDRFGLGFGIIEDIGKQPFLATEGTYYWGGAYNTAYFLDPTHQIYGVMMTQLYPNWHCDLKRRLRNAIYGALLD
ncbi:MAG: serine hydrolase domain-containing protein [Pirellulaceae bacterium]